MTFYNVISGLLFFAAIKAFLYYLGTPAMLLAAILVITILNEAVMTSELMERKESRAIEYTLLMKLLDFVLFTVLLWALLVLNPTERNNFQIDVQSTLWGANDARVFWILLAVYWGLMFVWNRVGGLVDSKKWKPVFIAMHVMWMLPLIALIFNCDNADLCSQASWTVWLNLILTACYLLGKLKDRT